MTQDAPILSANGPTLAATVGSSTGTLTAGGATNGPNTVTVAADDSAFSVSQAFTWTITSPVTLTTPAAQANQEGDAVSQALSASGGGTLKYAAVGLPAGLAINASTGVISGTVARGDSGIGVYAVTVNASDGTSSSSTSLVWHVSSAVSITDPGTQANVVGDTVSLQIGATDSSGTPVFAASGLPTGLSINASTGLISGTLSSGATAIGTFSTTVTVADGTATASDTFPWRVRAAGTVTLTTPANQSTVEGSTVSLALSASDSSSGTLRYFAVNLPPGLKINPSTGVISGTVAVGAAAAGPYAVTVIATNGTYRAFATFTWSVTSAVTLAAVSNQTTREGTAVSLALSGSDSSSGTVYYGAVGLPPGLTINTSTGAIAGTVALGAAAAGSSAVTVTAADSTSSASQTFTWTSSSPIALAAVADQSNTEGDTVAVSLSGSDASSGTLSYAAVGLPPGLKINPGTGAITGTVAVGASANGPYSVVVTASDGTYSASQAFTWNVNNPISITDPGVQNVSAGSTVNLQIQSSDSQPGTRSYSAFNLPVGLSINAATGLITGTISNAAAAAGEIISNIKVTDGTYSALQTIVWKVLASGLGLANIAVLKTAQARLNYKLTFKQAADPAAGEFGAFAWPITWHLNNKAAQGGFVLQVVTIRWKINLAGKALQTFTHNLLNYAFTVQTDAGNTVSIITRDNKTGIYQASYVEAFPVKANSTSADPTALPKEVSPLYKLDKVTVPNVEADDWYFLRGTRVYFGGTPPGAPVDARGRSLGGRVIPTDGWIEVTGMATYYDGMTLQALGTPAGKPVGDSGKVGGGFKEGARLTGSVRLYSRPLDDSQGWNKKFNMFVKQYSDRSDTVEHYLKATWAAAKNKGKVTITLVPEK